MNSPTRPYRNLDVNSTGALASGIKGSLRYYFAFNSTAATVYLKFYDVSTAAAAASTATPVLTLGIPAGSGANVAGMELEFTNGIGVRATTGVADADTTSPASNGLVLNLGIG